MGKLLGAAIGISLFAHAVLLLVHFRPFDLSSKTDKGPALEIALVNAKTVAKPVKADVLAQHNLDGGGNTDADRRAKTQLPVLPKSNPEQQVAVATRKVEALERQTQEMLTQLRAAPVVPAATPWWRGSSYRCHGRPVVSLHSPQAPISPPMNNSGAPGSAHIHA